MCSKVIEVQKNLYIPSDRILHFIVRGDGPNYRIILMIDGVSPLYQMTPERGGYNLIFGNYLYEDEKEATDMLAFLVHAVFSSEKKCISYASYAPRSEGESNK